jgi:pantoate--beta-alanine ligase
LQIFNTQIELEDFLSKIRKKGIKLGFVPTMGALHEGHLELVKKSVEENDYTIVSIFVNKLQFNNSVDFNNYPITKEQDIEMLKNVFCDAVFMPSTEVMYPDNYQKIPLDLRTIDNVFEGPLRPGHFDGVVQVVYRLFDYIKPNTAYFGLKDYQQCMVIKALKNAYFHTIYLVFCPTIRTETGLAMSSRNKRLSSSGLIEAAYLYKVLSIIRDLSIHIEAFDAVNYGKKLLQNRKIDVEYLELANADTLAHGKKWFRKNKNVILLAVQIEGVRLIDNIVF